MDRISNIVSVSWGDHLVFGEGDGRLDSPEALGRRLQKWKTELGACSIHWRCTRSKISGRYYQGRGYRHFFRSADKAAQWDSDKVVPELAHDLGVKAFLYVSIFDEGWPLLPKKVRTASYHNKMHCQHVTWQSDFSRNNPPQIGCTTEIILILFAPATVIDFSYCITVFTPGT